MARTRKAQETEQKKAEPQKSINASEIGLGHTSPNLDNDYDVVLWDQPLFNAVGSRSSVVFGILKCGGVLKVPVGINNAIGGIIRVVFRGEEGRDDEYVYYRKPPCDDSSAGGDL